MTDTSGPQAAVRALLVRVGERQLALPLTEVREVMRALPVEPVAGQPAHLLGLAVVRGKPRPVVDLGYLTTGQASQGAYYVLTKSGDRSVVLAVDAIDGIAALSGTPLADIPELRQGQSAPPITAVSLRGPTPVFLVDAAGLVRRATRQPGPEAA